MSDPLQACLNKDDFQSFFKSGKVAVAVSGGPDSMALALAMSEYAQSSGGLEVHALTVDHGLRPESWQEAESVHQMMSHWPHVTHTILKWDGEKPEERLQEAARAARYALMEQYCAAHGIEGLFLAHHRQDQAETFLFRLAKGSGLDGLSCMQGVQGRGAFSLLRPFLDISKDDLVAFCKARNIAYFDDPSNEKQRFARVRLRKSRAVLEAEGLSDKRLSVSAQRFGRARKALDHYAEEAHIKHLKNKETERIDFNLVLCGEPEEIVLRVLKKAIALLSPDEDGYGPREEKLEALVADLLTDDPFRKRTLGGVVFEKKRKEGLLSLRAERSE